MTISDTAAATPALVVSLPGAALRTALGPVPDGVLLVEWDMTGPAPLPHIDIAVPPYMGATPLLANLAGTTTRLVQSQSIGYDGVADVLPPGHVFANATSVHETSTAELTLALILASQRGIPTSCGPRRGPLGARAARQPRRSQPS